MVASLRHHLPSGRQPDELMTRFRAGQLLGIASVIKIRRQFFVQPCWRSWRARRLAVDCCQLLTPASLELRVHTKAGLLFSGLDDAWRGPASRAAASARLAGRKTHDFGNLLKLSRQRIGLAPDHADGARGL